MQSLDLSLNILQFLLPLLSLGDLATDIWFLVTVALRININANSNRNGSDNHNGSNGYVNDNLLAILMLNCVAMGIGMGIGVCRVVCFGDREREMLGDRCWVKGFYWISQVFNFQGMFLFFYQRCACFGPRLIEFQLKFQQNGSHFTLCIFHSFMYTAILICQIVGMDTNANQVFSYINISLTSIMLFYNFSMMPYFCGSAKVTRMRERLRLRKNGNKNIEQTNSSCCGRLYNCYEQFGEKIENRVFYCCPRRQYDDTSTNKEVKDIANHSNSNQVKNVVMINRLAHLVPSKDKKKKKSKDKSGDGKRRHPIVRHIDKNKDKDKQIDRKDENQEKSQEMINLNNIKPQFHFNQ